MPSLPWFIANDNLTVRCGVGGASNGSGSELNDIFFADSVVIDESFNYVHLTSFSAN